MNSNSHVPRRIAAAAGPLPGTQARRSHGRAHRARHLHRRGPHLHRQPTRCSFCHRRCRRPSGLLVQGLACRDSCASSIRRRLVFRATTATACSRVWAMSSSTRTSACFYHRLRKPKRLRVNGRASVAAPTIRCSVNSKARSRSCAYGPRSDLPELSAPHPQDADRRTIGLMHPAPATRHRCPNAGARTSTKCCPPNDPAARAATDVNSRMIVLRRPSDPALRHRTGRLRGGEAAGDLARRTEVFPTSIRCGQSPNFCRSRLAATPPAVSRQFSGKSDLVELTSLDATIKPRHPLRHDARPPAPRRTARRAHSAAPGRRSAGARAEVPGPRKVSACSCIGRLPAVVRDEDILGRQRRRRRLRASSLPIRASGSAPQPRRLRGQRSDSFVYAGRRPGRSRCRSLYDEMSERAYPAYAGGPEEPRRLREPAAPAHGGRGSCAVFQFEWWHFSTTA